MLTFEIHSIESWYLNVKITLKTIKNSDEELVNKKINFYILINEVLTPLDSTKFYTKYLPNNPTYEDSLLVNGQLLKFMIDTPLLISGLETRIVAVDEYSLGLKYISDPIFLKTKPISDFEVDIKNKYDKKFKSIITFNISELEEESIVKQYRLEQVVETYGINTKRVSTKSSSLDKKVFVIEHENVKEYGSYQIITKILNNNNETFFRNVSHYSKILQPLNVVCKNNLQNQDNFASTKPKAICVKIASDQIKTTKAIKVNV